MLPSHSVLFSGELQTYYWLLSKGYTFLGSSFWRNLGVGQVLTGSFSTYLSHNRTLPVTQYPTNQQSPNSTNVHSNRFQSGHRFFVFTKLYRPVRPYALGKAGMSLTLLRVGKSSTLATYLARHSSLASRSSVAASVAQRLFSRILLGKFVPKFFGIRTPRRFDPNARAGQADFKRISGQGALVRYGTAAHASPTLQFYSLDTLSSSPTLSLCSASSFGQSSSKGATPYTALGSTASNPSKSLGVFFSTDRAPG